MPPGTVLTRLLKPVFSAGLSIALDETRLDSVQSLCERETRQDELYAAGRDTDWGTD